MPEPEPFAAMLRESGTGRSVTSAPRNSAVAISVMSQDIGRACAAGCLLAAARHDEEVDEQFPGRLTRKRSHLRWRAAARWCRRRTCSSKGGTGPLMARPGAITEMGRAATGDAERPQPERHALSWALDAA